MMRRFSGIWWCKTVAQTGACMPFYLIDWASLHKPKQEVKVGYFFLNVAIKNWCGEVTCDMSVQCDDNDKHK